MKQVTCDFCGTATTVVVHTLHDILLQLPGQFTLVQCTGCKLFYLNPRPDWQELAAHYPDHYHPFIGAIEDQPSKLVRWAQRYGVKRRCHAITRRQHSGRLLDIGCATGVFLHEMQQHGAWELQGVEPVASAANFARERFGLPVFQGTLLESNYPDSFFDVVTMWDVLEHVADPHAQLHEIHRILKPGGWVILKVPDPLSWEARLFGASWIGYDAPRHLYGFPRATLIRQLATLGFETMDVVCLAGGYYTFTASLGFWLDARGATRLAQRLHRLSRSTAMRVLTAPAFMVMRWMGQGSSLSYFARKIPC